MQDAPEKVPLYADEGVNTMKRTLSGLLILCLMLTIMPLSYAQQQHQKAVYELYSEDGCYEDDVGNRENYSYHVPQIYADTPAAKEINAEIAEKFGSRVETQYRYMEGGYSLSLCYTGWQAYWSGTRMFLLITAVEDGDLRDYAAYGYDFETGNRVTNEMILEQKGISREAYLEALKAKVQLMFKDMFWDMLSKLRRTDVYDDMLEKTMFWLDADQPIFLNEYGEIETIVKFVTVAGAGLNHYLVTPFSDQGSGDRTYRISLEGDTFLVESCPESAKEGETVTVHTYDVTDGDKKISVSGVDGTEVNWFEYQFVMPDHDVVVQVEFMDYGLA